MGHLSLQIGIAFLIGALVSACTKKIEINPMSLGRPAPSPAEALKFDEPKSMSTGANLRSIFVAPNGADTNDGSINRPLRTLTAAQNKVRAIKASGLPISAIEVRLRGGTYYLPEKLTFGPDDGGTSTYSVSYLSYPGEVAVLSGGTLIRSWTATPDPSVFETSTGGIKVRQLYNLQALSGTRPERARFPSAANTYFKMVESIKEGLFLQTLNSGVDTRAKFNTITALSMRSVDTPTAEQQAVLEEAAKPEVRNVVQFDGFSRTDIVRNAGLSATAHALWSRELNTARHGLFRVGEGIYTAHGPEYCAFRNYEDYLRASNNLEVRKVPTYSRVPSEQRYVGACLPESGLVINEESKGIQKITDQSYCSFQTWDHFVKITGRNDARGLPTVLSAAISRLQYNGACLPENGPIAVRPGVAQVTGRTYCFYRTWDHFVSRTLLSNLESVPRYDASILYRLTGTGACR